MKYNSNNGLKFITFLRKRYNTDVFRLDNNGITKLCPSSATISIVSKIFAQDLKTETINDGKLLLEGSLVRRKISDYHLINY